MRARHSEDHLALVGVDVRYGALQVLFGVDLTVAKGEVLALLGTNGAGKSTILRAAAGLTSPSAGTVHLDGTDITSLDPAARVRAGLVNVCGGKAVFGSLTVGENLTLGGFTLRKEPAVLASRTEAVLELFPGLRARLDQPAGSLSGGQQQMLALAKGLLLNPQVLCIDELSLGLAPKVVEDLMRVVESLREAGTTMVIVEQSLNVALALADRAIFLEKGHVRFEGPAAELAERDDLARAVFFGVDR